MKRILTMSWADRLDLLGANIRRMVRTGAQSVLVGLGLDLTSVDGFTLDYLTAAGLFLGGCFIWVVTTLAAPPKE